MTALYICIISKVKAKVKKSRIQIESRNNENTQNNKRGQCLPGIYFMVENQKCTGNIHSV